jgi:hypothetical protein
MGMAQRIVDLEVDEIRKALDRHLTTRSRESFDKWLDDFYETHSQDVMKDVLPLLMKYANDIQRAANGEVDAVPEMTPELNEFVRQYAETFGVRYSSSSRGQLQSLLEGVAPEEVRDAIETRIDDWRDKRPVKVAERETVQANNAVARFVFIAAGVVKFRWVAQGSKSCPYCQELNGKVVGVNSSFIKEGPFEPKGSDGSMKIRGPKFNPPLHQGCICSIQPGI